jgi:hypothetical protein
VPDAQRVGETWVPGARRYRGWAAGSSSLIGSHCPTACPTLSQQRVEPTPARSIHGWSAVPGIVSRFRRSSRVLEWRAGKRRALHTVHEAHPFLARCASTQQAT